MELTGVVQAPYYRLLLTWLFLLSTVTHSILLGPDIYGAHWRSASSLLQTACNLVYSCFLL
jgi:hypothetical protein